MASAAAPASARGIPRNTPGPTALTPNTVARIRRASPYAGIRPTARPTHAVVMPLRNSMPRTFPRGAPNAIRMPISCVRAEITDAVTPYTPTAESASANRPKVPIMAAMYTNTKASCWIRVLRVFRFAMGCSGSSARIACRTAGHTFGRGADSDIHLALRRLGNRQVDRRNQVAVDHAVLDIAYHADDRHPRPRPFIAYLYAAANG